MKNDHKLFNYTLSIGFILLIVVFIVVMIVMSRYVLSETNSISNYVFEAQTLLEDVNEVEVSTKDSNLVGVQIDDKDLLRLKFNNYQENILDVSSINIKDNKSIISIVLDSKIETIDNIYYLKIDNLSDISKGYELVYVNEESLEFGKVFSVNMNKVRVLNVESKELVDLEFVDILGKVILEYDKQKD